MCWPMLVSWVEELKRLVKLYEPLGVECGDGNLYFPPDIHVHLHDHLNSAKN